VKRAPGDAQGGFARDPATWMAYGLVGYFAFMETVLGPIMPFLRRELDLSYTAASLHFSAFALGAVLLGFLGDRVVGRWGRRAALWGGAAGMAVGAVLLISSPSVFGTVPAAFAMGLCGAQILVTTQALLSDRHGEWSAVALTESNVTASACAIAAPLLVGGFAASGLGWRAALALPAVALVLLAAGFFSRPLDPPRNASDDAPANVRTLPPRYWAFWTLVALGVASEWCVAYWGADFLAGCCDLPYRLLRRNARGPDREQPAGAYSASHGPPGRDPLHGAYWVPALLVLARDSLHPRRPLHNGARHRQRLPARNRCGHRVCT
jgi:MFS family permease